MPPDLNSDDYCLSTHEAWQFAAKQMRSEEMVTFVNTRDSEEGYPFLKSELHMRYKVPPFIHPQHPTTVSAAFGNFMYSKLVRTLRDNNLIVRRKSVAWAVELLSVAENRARCIAAGFVPILADMMREKDMYIRQQLALCYKHLAEAGQNICGVMCYLNVVKGLIQMVSSDDKILRGNALQALQALCSISHLVRYELIKTQRNLSFILRRINEEEDVKLIVYALEILSKCISGANYNKKALQELLEVDAIPTALRLIQSPFRTVQESAARFLCLMCMHNEGKVQAVENQAVASLAPLLSDIEPRVQAFACAALLCITIDIQGKKDFVMVKGIPVILQLLDLTDEQLCLYDIALMLNVAEFPIARALLFKDALVILRNIIKTSTSPLIKKRSKQALQMLHFKHLPFQFPYDKEDILYQKKQQEEAKLARSSATVSPTESQSKTPRTSAVSFTQPPPSPGSSKQTASKPPGISAVRSTQTQPNSPGSTYTQSSRTSGVESTELLPRSPESTSTESQSKLPITSGAGPKHSP